MSEILNKLEKEIAEGERKLAEARAWLENTKADLAAMPPEKKLAVALHELLCHSNHTDGCGWFYEIRNNVHDWNRGTHNDYLQMANRFVIKFECTPIPNGSRTSDRLAFIIDCLREVRYR